jgi:hypothetical protein
LVAEAKAADATLRRSLADIEHIDGAIRAYDPSQRPRKVQLTRAAQVDTSRSVLTILRNATAPMTLRDITYGVMAKQGADLTDAKMVRTRLERVRVVLLRHKKAGTLRSSDGPGRVVLWEVAR